MSGAHNAKAKSLTISLRLKSEMDRMVQYGRDPGEETYDRLDAMRAQLPS